MLTVGRSRPVNIDAIETSLSVKFPATHRRALSDRSDPIHAACDFLVGQSPHELLRLNDVNASLRASDNPDPWPAYLVAFASNGCGDYFAYDTRPSPYLIVYIDPDDTVAENLAMDDGYTFESFDEWHAAKCRQHEAVKTGECPGLRDGE